MLFMSISFVFLAVVFAVIASGDKRKNKIAGFLILVLIGGGLNQAISSQYGIYLKLISFAQISAGENYKGWNSFANIFTAIAILVLTIGVLKTISIIKIRMVPGLSVIAVLFGDMSYRIIPEIVLVYDVKEPFASAISAVVVLLVCIFLAFYCAESYTDRKPSEEE